MERLTTRNIAGVAVYKYPFECERCGETIYRLPDYGNGSPTNKLAEYEDAEEQGVYGKWIPVSERLPEEPFGCLVTVMDCEPSTQTDFENIFPYFVGYDGGSWNDSNGKKIPFEVIAWMPLPEPYRESEVQ